MVFELFFDVETQKLFSDITSDDPADLGISVVSVYTRFVDDSQKEVEGEIKSFWHPEAGLAPNLTVMWDLFERADRIIGFNSKKFDVPALRPFYAKDLSKLPHFDILERIKGTLGKRISLNALAQNTLGVNKTDVGTNAIYYWANRTRKNLQRLQTYCESDVLITRDLYDFGKKHNHLKYMDTKWNRIETIPVDFSYPQKPEDSQIGLF